MTVIFSEDDGGCPRRIVHQSQLSKVISLVQCGHQPLKPALSHSPPSHQPLLGQTQTHVWEQQPWDSQEARPRGPEARSTDTPGGCGGRAGELTLPWVTTLTDPFQIMYHEVPLSPWLNTDRSTDHISPLLSPTPAPPAPDPVANPTYTQSLPCCVVQRAERQLIPASPRGGQRKINSVSLGRRETD